MKTFIVKLKGGNSLSEMRIEAQSAESSTDKLVLLGPDGEPVAEFMRDSLAGWCEESTRR